MDSYEYGTTQESRGRSRSRSSSGRSRRLRRRASSSLSSSRGRSTSRGPRSRAAIGNRTFVVSRNLRLNSFMPNRIECVMCTVGDFYWSAGQMTGAAGNYFNLNVNSRTPLTGNTYTITAAATGPSPYNCSANAIQGTAIGNTPIGWTSYSTLYQNYRVKKYRIELTFIPQNVSDSVRLISFPLGQEAIPSTAAGNVNTRVFEAQPGAKAITCAVSTAASPGLSNTMIIYGDCAKDLGKTLADYMGLADTPSSSAPAAGTADTVGFFLQQLHATNNVASCSMQLKITQNVVWYDLLQDIN